MGSMNKARQMQSFIFAKWISTLQKGWVIHSVTLYKVAFVVWLVKKGLVTVFDVRPEKGYSVQTQSQNRLRLRAALF